MRSIKATANGAFPPTTAVCSSVTRKLSARSCPGEIQLSNRDFGPVLFYLLVDQTPEGWGPVHFRSLSVREFGTIYEGLLENELSVAPADLAVTPRESIGLHERRTRSRFVPASFIRTPLPARVNQPARISPNISPSSICSNMRLNRRWKKSLKA